MATSLSKRNSEICERYLKENISAERLAADVGLSTIRVQQILKAGNVSRKDRGVVEKPDKVISALHLQLGNSLAYHRAFTLKISRPDMGDLLQWSYVKLAAVEHGTYNLTLLDLNDLARLYKISTSAMLAATEAAVKTSKGKITPC